MEIRRINYEEIPNKAFIKVKLKRDVLKARIMSKKERKENIGSASDIIAESILGGVSKIDRDYVIKNFRHINGNKIKIAQWSSKVPFIITRDADDDAFAFMIPLGYEVTINDIKYTSSDKNKMLYLVCSADDDGNIQRNSMLEINSALFKKLFYIGQDMLTEFKSSARSGENYEFESNNIAQAENNSIKVSPKIKINRPEQVNKNKNTKIAKAIGRICHNDKTVGFVIESNDNKRMQITTQKMMELCNKKLVSNIELVRDEENNKMFLRGNGIKIGELKVINM